MRKKTAFLCRNNLLVPLLLFFLFCITQPVAASIQIDSVRTTVSTCPNNGSIVVFAVTNAPAILYSIIAGPVTQPVQTNNLFSSLPAGTYTISVVNALAESVTQVVTVAGNYTQLDFVPLAKAPRCAGGNDGQIIGNLSFNTGNAPYTWELVSPSPILAGPQANDTFTNLIAGNYSVRVTDACGSFRTIVATVPDMPATNLTLVQEICRIEMVGCDSALVNFYFGTSAYRFPITCTFTTNAGTFTTTTPTRVDTTTYTGGIVIEQIFPGFTYGDFVSATFTDACGSTTSLPMRFSSAFTFCPYTSADFNGCNYLTSINYDLNNLGCYNQFNLTTYAKAPLTYTITDMATSLVVETDTVPGFVLAPGYNVASGFQLNPLPGNKNYNISIRDSCGRVFTHSFFLPDTMPPAPYVAGIQLSPDGCVDSVGLAGFNVSYFRNDPKIIFLSGPATMGSTKPGYEYTNMHVYPDTVTDHGHFWGISADIFLVSGLSVGTYQFKVIDSCGSEVFDSVTITGNDVSNFHHRFWYKKGCLGQNEIHYSANNPSGIINITNLSTGIVTTKYYSSQDWANPINDSILNLPSGTYAIDFTYWGYISTTTGVNSMLNYSPINCQVILDTIVIEGYQTPVLATANSILCHNTINMLLLPDSSKGVPPYQYEIIAGPQLFPVQNSNVFTVNSAGTYTARIYDICGNASTASITADTISFPPLQPIQRTCNSISFTYGASPYYSYNWTGPNGQQYTSDTLSINPVTAADTGIYQISRIVDINGCRDTFYTSYHLTFPVTYRQVKTICTGSSVSIGNSTYNSTGVYTDTLISINGCDSIVVLDLTVTAFKTDSLVRNICAGQQFVFGTHTYSNPGIYRDTLLTATCDSIAILDLRVDPVKQDSAVKNICAGQAVTVGTHIYRSTGIYRDTLSTATCDSIVITNLRVEPFKQDSVARSICTGQSLVVGAHTYNSTGIYRDTLPTATCDSIVITNLRVEPFKQDSVARNICTGQSIVVGAHTYNSTGIYRDTLATATCDSIIVTNLRVDSFKKDSIVREICTGEQVIVNTHIYNSAGIYRDTLTTATCDSIVILNLTVNPAPAVGITATPQSVTAGGVVQLTTSAAASYVWSSAATLSSTSIQNPVATLYNSAWIYLQATASPGDCTAVDSVFVRVIPDTTQPCGINTFIYVPNAFTPDGNTINDVFKIRSNNIRLATMQVYNRWGEMVFKTSDINTGWDGTYKGKILPGNYVYSIVYFECNRNNQKILKGSVVLIR